MSQVKTVDVVLPVLENENRGYVSRWVTNFSMTEGQATALRMVERGLVGIDAVLESGRRVSSSTQALQWLLEEVARRHGLVIVVEDVSPTLPGLDQIKK